MDEPLIIGDDDLQSWYLGAGAAVATTVFVVWLIRWIYSEYDYLRVGAGNKYILFPFI